MELNADEGVGGTCVDVVVIWWFEFVKVKVGGNVLRKMVWCVNCWRLIYSSGWYSW